MSNDFMTVTIHNGDRFVVSAFLNAQVPGPDGPQPWSTKTGNIGQGTHALQIPKDATSIQFEVHGEEFINVWKTICKLNWADTNSWPTAGLAFETSGTSADMHCKSSS